MSLTEAECRQLLSLYDKALTSRIDVHKSKNGAKDLLQLDSWRLNELAKSVRERAPSFMSKEELEKLMDCKLSRGKFRPRLKQLISSNVATDVKSSTQKGFSELGSPLTIESIITATKTLSELKGVGPATATMVLQAASDEVPFMSDEAMLQVFEGDKTKLKYDLKTCKLFIENIYEIVASLNKEFTAAEVERALFAKELLGTPETKKPTKRPADSISPPPKKKRAASEVKASNKGRKMESNDASKSKSNEKRTSLRGKQA